MWHGNSVSDHIADRASALGLRDGELAPAVLADPARTWTSADVLELVAGQPRDFAPDTQFAYSNTNYIVAGLLLEGVTGTTLAQNLQSRIVAPLYVALAEALGCSLGTDDQRSGHTQRRKPSAGPGPRTGRT